MPIIGMNIEGPELLVEIWLQPKQKKTETDGKYDFRWEFTFRGELTRTMNQRCQYHAKDIQDAIDAIVPDEVHSITIVDKFRE